MSDGEIWEIEKGFWLDGAGFYAAHMLPEAQMVFPEPVGILNGDGILDGLKDAARWKEVKMTRRTELPLGDVLVLAYRATGSRGEGAPYVALCSSTYVLRDKAWKLVSHQQTPVA